MWEINLLQVMPMLGGLRASTCSFSLCWARPQLPLIWQFCLAFSSFPSKSHINSSEKAKQDRLGNGTRAGLAVVGSGPAPCYLCNIRFALLLHLFLYFSQCVLISQELKSLLGMKMKTEFDYLPQFPSWNLSGACKKLLSKESPELKKNSAVLLVFFQLL